MTAAEKTKAWREANPERHKAYQRAYKARYRDRLALRERARYRSEKDLRCARQRTWRVENPDKHNDQQIARRARKKAAFIEMVDRAVVYQMHGGMCGICEEFINGVFHVDHIRPLAIGGAHCYANVQPAHASCNLKKKRK